jgi:hypothetical protein
VTLYIGIHQAQLHLALRRPLEGQLAESQVIRIVGRQVHLLYRRFGLGGWFYLRGQERRKAGKRSLSHAGLRQILLEGAESFLDPERAGGLVSAQLREFLMEFSRAGWCYLARGAERTAMPTATEQAIFRAWYLGGEDSEPEILNTHQISRYRLEQIIARGQAEGWMRS